MKIAAAQMSTTENKEENLAKILMYIQLASKQNADMVILPEMAMALVTANNGLKPAEVAESVNGPFVSALQKSAKEGNIYVVCGIFESIPDNTQQAFNTIVAINSNGALERIYRKTHLYDAFSYKESDTILPGQDLFQVMDTPFGKIGMMVCYELRFPEVARHLVDQNADLIIIPAGWVKGPLKEEHWQTLLKARAIENTVFVCGCNQSGTVYTGRSMLVDPMGVVMADAGEEEGLIATTIDFGRIDTVRKTVPCLNGRRRELYTQ
ncbi:carbon-nitrogen hydrolase family protein [Bacillus sp. 1P06AnD]|uniref:carbon-nitrogen hydrolase family protein n=1 Tax=Bacillus sp. 1P06AnD TaxID=3132208 RepID=UPI0039A1C5AF